MTSRTFARATALLWATAAILVHAAAPAPDATRGTLRSVSTAVHFDVSPPLREIPVRAPDLDDENFFGSLMVDPDPYGKFHRGPQDVDARVQTSRGVAVPPAPLFNFNVGVGGANPPDPVGDVGPNHYVRMANSTFQIFDKTTGVSVFGPANINTLFAGFGGACETENAGDPIVLYDQAADRWLLSQFSDSAGPGFFNCVALSQTSDPTGAYFRWAFTTPTFPDYPKYGVWPDAYFISTREVNAGLIGAYAVSRADMLAGDPTPTIVQFAVPVTEFSGDGLLPSDWDGDTPPPPGAPNYYIGSMDDGGPYGAAEDALSLWEFDVDFVTPANSTFTLVNVIPIAPYDTIYPCLPSNGRACIPVPGGLTPVDILSYRQRPMHRAAYRNFGSYQAIVTNQSVEAATAMAGIRWWEIRNPGADAELHQDSTYAPGVSDGIHRWMGSIAQDRSGNMALGYSTASPSLFPSVSYTARLEHDPLNDMAQGEGTFVIGGGSRTGTTVRWGDYTSMNVDPVDDCTFWFVNKYYVASGTQWTMRAGAFRFPDCGTPNLGISVLPSTQRVCATTPAEYRVDAHGYNGFSSATNLSASVPAGGVPTFSPPTIATVPGSSILSVDASGIAPGAHTLSISGDSTSPAFSRSRTVGLFVDSAAPGDATLLAPADGSTSQPLAPLLSWSAATEARDYVVEVATDAGFGSVIFTSPPTTGTSLQLPPVLAPGTTYFWRVRAINACGEGSNSATASFTTRFAPGTCPAGDVITSAFFDDVESGTNGWTTVPAAGTTWTRSTARPSSGAFAWLAVDVAVTSAQRLISPPIAVPSGGNSPTLRFRHDVTMEPNTATTCFDGGFVEISTDNGGSWTALGVPSQLEDFYTGPLGTGEQAWCGTRPYRTASFDLTAFAGQTIRLRFSALTDSSVGSAPHGWYVDDVSVESCQVQAPNEAPQLITPVVFTGFEDLPMPFGGIVPSDPDAGSAPVQLTMDVSTGTLTASNTGGVTATGSGTSTVVLTGPIASVHAYITSGAVTFLLGPDLSGSATLDLTLDDLGNTGAGGPLTATASVPISIAATDDAPQAVNDAPPALLEDAATTVIDVLANDTDIDGGPMSVVFLSPVNPIEAGSAAIGGGGSHVEFTPAADFCGNTVEFDYILAGGSSARATFAITCVNDAPRLAAALPDIASGEETPLSIATAAGFVDVDDASLQYTMSSVPALPGTVTIDAASGVIGGVPGSGSAGVYTVTVTASDAEPLSAQRSFTLTLLETAIFDDGFEQP